MGKQKKKEKFRYNESEFTEELSEMERTGLMPEAPIQRKTILCPSGHTLDERNWSPVRNSYYCVFCFKNYSKKEVSKQS